MSSALFYEVSFFVTMERFPKIFQIKPCNANFTYKFEFEFLNLWIFFRLTETYF